MANRFLNNITINDAYTLPSEDGTDGQIITTDGSGILSFDDPTASDAIVLTVKNVSGGSLSKGTVVYASPSADPPSGNIIEVSAADNSSASTMPALAVLNTTLADGAEGEAIAFGQVSGIDTSAFTAGDAIYVNDSGGFSEKKPKNANLIQKIGMVVKSHASNGSIKIFGAFRANDVPNILHNHIWLGSFDGVATPTEHLLNNVKDVTTSSPTDGQVLTWDNTNSYWKNADAANDATITLTAGNGITGGGDFTTDQSTNQSITFNLDFTQLTDMTNTISGSTQFILNDEGAESRKSASEINLSVFNNDSGFISDAVIVTESEGIGSRDDDTSIPTSAAVKDYVDSQQSGGIDVSVISSNTTAVSGTLYVLTANLTLTLPPLPSPGNYIKVSNRSGVATCTIARNSEKIQGADSDLTIDKLDSGFEMIYSGSAQGWILIGVEGTSA